MLVYSSGSLVSHLKRWEVHMSCWKTTHMYLSYRQTSVFLQTTLTSTQTVGFQRSFVVWWSSRRATMNWTNPQWMTRRRRVVWGRVQPPPPRVVLEAHTVSNNQVYYTLKESWNFVHVEFFLIFINYFINYFIYFYLFVLSMSQSLNIKFPIKKNQIKKNKF